MCQTAALHPQEYFWYSFLLEAEWTLEAQCSWNKSTEKSNDLIAKQTCDLLACSTVPQPTIPLHAPEIMGREIFYIQMYI
jgi:hypothetical protein